MCPSQTILLRQLLTRAHAQLLFTCLMSKLLFFFFCLPYSPFDGSGRILSDGHKYEYATILTAYWAKVNKDEIWKSKEETFEGRMRKKKTHWKWLLTNWIENWERALWAHSHIAKCNKTANIHESLASCEFTISKAITLKV